jgi:hypothetical protein
MKRAADHDGPDPGRSASDGFPGPDRGPTERAVIDALVEREGEGMTVFELRSRVDADIDELEDTLAHLDREGCIDVDATGDRTRILATEAALAARENESDRSLYERVRELLLL